MSDDPYRQTREQEYWAQSKGPAEPPKLSEELRKLLPVDCGSAGPAWFRNSSKDEPSK